MNVSELIERLREYGLVAGKPYTAQDCACHDAADALEAQAREIRQADNRGDEALREVHELQDFLRSNGFVECDIAACNCGSWHARFGWIERFREIEDATKDEERNGERLLDRINRIMSRLAAAERERDEAVALLRHVMDECACARVDIDRIDAFLGRSES